MNFTFNHISNMKTQSISISEVKNFAGLEGLNCIEITGSLHGCPEPVTGVGVTGFTSFEACQEFASKFDAEIYNFNQKDGWHFWNADNCRYTQSQFTIEELSRNYEHYEVVYDLEDLKDCDRFDPEFFSDATLVQIGNYLALDNAVILTFYNGEFKVKDTISAGMSYNYDSSRYEIGVYFPFSDFHE